MRTIVTETTVYDVHELREHHPDGFERAHDRFAEDYWRSGLGHEEVPEVLTYGIAGGFKTPGWDTYGQGDFPGIPGISIDEWDMEYGREYLRLEGTLCREDAPGLPWPEDCDRARFGRANRDWTGSHRELLLEDSYPEWIADEEREDVQAFWARLDEIIADALLDARKEVEYRQSEESFLEDALCNDWEFDEDGILV